MFRSTEFGFLSNLLVETLFLRSRLAIWCNSELFWSAFSRNWNEYGEILRISRYSVQMQENADQNNSEYGHFLRSESNFVLSF